MPRWVGWLRRAVLHLIRIHFPFFFSFSRANIVSVHIFISMCAHRVSFHLGSLTFPRPVLSYLYGIMLFFIFLFLPGFAVAILLI